MSTYGDYENGEYVFKYFNDEDKEYFRKGYDYFNTLEEKRTHVARYVNNHLVDFGCFTIEEYNNLPRGKQLQFDYGFDKAVKEYVSKKIKPFLDEVQAVYDKYKVFPLFGECGCYDIEIDGVMFNYG